MFQASPGRSIQVPVGINSSRGLILVFAVQGSTTISLRPTTDPQITNSSTQVAPRSADAHGTAAPLPAVTRPMRSRTLDESGLRAVTAPSSRSHLDIRQAAASYLELSGVLSRAHRTTGLNGCSRMRRGPSGGSEVLAKGGVQGKKNWPRRA